RGNYAPRRTCPGAAARRPGPESPRGSPRRGPSGRSLSPVARRGRELRQHAAAPAPARVSAGAGHLRDLDGRVSPGLPGPGQAGRLRRQLGERRAAPRGRRACWLRRSLRAVPLPSQLAHVDSVHHAAGLASQGGRTMNERLVPTAVVGSYSMPGWLERVKNDYLQRRISRHDLDEIHDMAVKAAIKDQEVAGIDIVTDGELRRDNMIAYFALRVPGGQNDHSRKRVYSE